MFFEVFKDVFGRLPRRILTLYRLFKQVFNLVFNLLFTEWFNSLFNYLFNLTIVGRLSKTMVDNFTKCLRRFLTFSKIHLKTS